MTNREALYDRMMFKLAFISYFHPDYEKIETSTDSKKDKIISKIIDISFARMTKKGFNENLISLSSLTDYEKKFDSQLKFWSKFLRSYREDIEAGKIYSKTKKQIYSIIWRDLIDLTAKHFQ